MSDKYYFLGVKYLIFMSETKKLNLFSPLCKLCLLIAQWLRARGKNESTRVALVANAKSEVQLPFLNFVFLRKIPNVLKRKFVGLMDIAEGEID